MTPNQKKFLAHLSFYYVGSLIAITFTNLYLWQSAKDFIIIAYYNAYVFISMAIGGLLASVLATRLGNKITYSIALVLFSLQMCLILYLGKHAFSYLMIIGSVSGLAIGMQSFSYNIVSQLITTTLDREQYFGTRSAFLNGIYLFAAPLISFAADYFGTFIPLFAIAFALFIIGAYLVFNLELKEVRSTYKFNSIISIIYSNKDIDKYLAAKFLYGLQDGLFWVAWGIMTLEFVGNLRGYGIFNFLLTVFNILIAYLYGKYITWKTANVSAVIVTIIYTVVSFYFASTWNLPSFILFSGVCVFLWVIMVVDFDSFFAHILEDVSDYRQEFNGLGEFVMNIGRLLCVSIILATQVNLEDSLYLRFAFVLIAPVAYFIMNVLNTTRMLTKKD